MIQAQEMLSILTYKFQLIQVVHIQLGQDRGLTYRIQVHLETHPLIHFYLLYLIPVHLDLDIDKAKIMTVLVEQLLLVALVKT